MDEKKLLPIPKNPHFSRVKEAREALQQKASKWAEAYDKIIEGAMKRGDMETAMKAVQWAFEHMPKEADGTSVIDQSVDKPKVSDGYSGPRIQIGLALGGLTHQEALPPARVEVIDLEPETQTSETEAIPCERSPIEQS